MVARRFLLVLFAALIAATQTSAIAATIHERVVAAHQRIEHGIRSGSLSRDEAHRLRNQLNYVRDQEARARADGHLDRRERERLSAELSRLENRISRYKHNDVGRRDGR